jgi:hypothetical protein
MEKYYGKYRGYVKENRDPRKEGRCRLICPAVLGDLVTDWAHPCNNLFFGMIMIPNINDPVWVEFEGGNIQRPIYSCSWYASPAGQPNMPSIAKGEGDETTNKGDDSFQNGSGDTISEPSEPYAAQYPYNRAIKTLRKLTIELDDTPGSERVKIYHPSGTMTEIHPSGQMVSHIEGDEYKKNSANKNNNINGNYNLGVGHNKDEQIGQSHIASITSNEEINIGSNQDITIGANQTVNIVANKEETIGANNTKMVTGQEDETVLAGKTATIVIQNDLTVTGVNNRTVTGMDTQTIGGVKQLSIAGPLLISAASISLSTPNGSFSMSSGVFDFNVPQCNFNIDQCTFNTQTMNLNSTGQMTRTSGTAIVDSAPSIDHI